MEEQKFSKSYLATIIKEKPDLSDGISKKEGNTNKDVSKKKSEIFDDFWSNIDVSYEKCEIKKVHKEKIEKIFCSCKHSFEVSIKYKSAIIVEQENPFDENSNFVSKNVFIKDAFEPIICENCGKTYKDFSELTALSHKLKHNLIEEKFLTFSNENKIVISKITRFAGVNRHSDNLFFLTKRKDFIYKKDTKRFYLIDYGSKKKNNNLAIKSVGIRNFSIILNRFFDFNLNALICNDIRNQEFLLRNYESGFKKPLNNALDFFLKEIDNRDVDRIRDYIKKSYIINERIKLGINKTSYEVSRNYFEGLSIIASIIQYPKLSTLLFTKGDEFFNKLTQLDNFPPPSYLKKKNETKPKKIFEDIIEKSVKYNYDLSKKHKSYDVVLQKTKKDNCKNVKISKSVFDAIENNNDVLIIQEIFARKFDYNIFQKLCDNHTPRKVFDVFINIFNRIPGRHYYGNNIAAVENLFNEEDYPIINHILRIYELPKICDSSDVKNVFFGGVKRLKNEIFDFSIYLDTIRIAQELEIGREIVFECDNWLRVCNLHDDLVERAKIVKLEKFDKGIKEFCKKYEQINTTIIEDIEFKLIISAIGLERESKDMHHCVRTYAQGLSKGRHLIFSVHDKKTEERGTLEFLNNSSNYDENGIPLNDTWIFNQLKAKYNNLCSEKMCKTTLQFCEKVLKKNKINFVIKEGSRDLYPLRENKDLEKGKVNDNWLI